MDFTLKEDLFNGILNLLWIVLTYGYIPHILLGFSLIFLFFTLLMIGTEYRVIRFLIMDKYYFFRNFMYYWVIEKIRFAKSYYMTIKFSFSHYNIYAWVILSAGLLLVVLFVVVLYTWTKNLSLGQ